MEEDERPPKTEASVARDFFMKELLIHHISNPISKTDTLVILQDACFKHRYERPFGGGGKAGLSLIVERPERLQAVYNGVAMAYVRLGERHQDGKHQIGPDMDPAGLQVPFDIRKTNSRMSLHSPQVTNVHGTKWMEELTMLCGTAKSKLDAGILELQRPEIDRGPGAKLPEPFHKGDLYLSPESLAAFEGALGATCEAVDNVFSDSSTKRVFVAVRPPGHHCDAQWPHGFCWLNNVQVGIMHGIMNHGLTHAAIIDFDLHHGDGSQDIAWDYNSRKHYGKGNMAMWKKASIGYFSIHDINSYPCEAGDPESIKKASLCIEDAFSQNIWNVHLQHWKDLTDFWYQYRTRIAIVLEKARAYLRRETEKYRAAGQEPKAVIFLSAGFDASEYETVGMQRHSISVPTEFYARLSRDVVKLSFEDGLAVDGRIVSCLEGGYSDRALASGVLAHVSGLAGGDIRAKEDTAIGLGRSASHRVSVSLSSSPLSRRSTVSSESDARSKAAGFPYESSWWSASELDRLDAAKTSPVAQPRAPRTVATPTYCSPTQASNAKVSDLAKARRSISGLSQLGNEAPVIPRGPSPPPPVVQWPTAAVELGRLLIPSETPVASIEWDDLKDSETRIRKVQKEQKERDRKLMKEQKERERYLASSSPIEGSTTTEVSNMYSHDDVSLITGVGAIRDEANIQAMRAPPNTPIVRKSARERKPISYTEPEDPNKNRRRTVAGAAVLASEKVLIVTPPAHNQDADQIIQVAARGVPSVQESRHIRQPSRRLSASSAMSTTVPAVVHEPSLPRPDLTPAEYSDRPGTTHTARPDSSLSVRTTTGALTVKKIRPAAVRKDSTKTAAPNAKRPKVTAPKASTADTKGKSKSSTSTGQTSARSSKSSSPAQGQNNVGQVSSTETFAVPTATISDSGPDLGGITNSMRKIKINVVTKEMKEAREQAARERSSAAATPVLEESSPFPVVPKIEVPPVETAQLPVLGRLPTPSSPSPTTYSAPRTPNQENYAPAKQRPTLGFGEHTPSPIAIVPTASENGDLFIPYQPEGAPPQAIAQTAPTQWLPPNTLETPAGFRGHNFTATSAIPFSPSPTKHTNPQPPSMGSLPGPPPQQRPTFGGHVATPAPINRYELFASNRLDREKNSESTDVQHNDVDMWEIPETPQNRM